LAQDNFKSKYTVSQERSVAQHWQGDKKHTRPLILRGAKITSARSASCSSWRGPGRKRRRRGRAEETVEEKKEIAEPGKEEVAVGDVAVGDVAVGGGEARGGEARRARYLTFKRVSSCSARASHASAIHQMTRADEL
jgi:hypothetical protein